MEQCLFIVEKYFNKYYGISTLELIFYNYKDVP
jgi:hypothetical protein